MIRIAGIQKESIVDGPGFRYVIFAQGCPHKCKGCHNEEALSFGGGEDREIKSLLDEALKNPLLKGITFSGGEPFSQSDAFADITKIILKTHLDLVVYTGYKYEELVGMARQNGSIDFIIKNCDILIDGKYVEAERDLTLKFRGSKNQRIIDIKATTKMGKIVLMEEYM